MPDNVIVTVNKQEQSAMETDLIEAVVDTNVFLPAMFCLTLQDEADPNTGKYRYADSDIFAVGAEVKIEIQTDEIPGESRDVRAMLIIGEVTAIEPSFSPEGIALLRVRGYDRAHRLTRGRKTRTYGDANPQGSGIGEDRIIQTIIQETDGIVGNQVDTSGISSLKYPYVMQYNQNDLDFLWSRAQRIGYQIYVEDNKFYFQKADVHRGSASQKPAKLIWPLNLSSFEPRLTLMHQIDKAEVRGWNPETKQAISGVSKADSSKTIPKVGLNKKGSALAKEKLRGSAEDVVVDQPVYTVDEAKAVAQAVFSEAEAEFITADGTCRQGDPRLIAGRVVTIEGVGQRFSGDYYVTESRHVFVSGSYRVSFSVTGRTPHTLSYLLSQDHGQDHDHVYGVVTAKVTSLEDPENLGRVRLMFPWLPQYNGADLGSNWARIATPMAGKERGLFFMPEVDDEVLVAFDHGDVNFPYVVGVLWNKTDKPPKGAKDSVLASDKKGVDERVIRSRSGHLIVLDDTQGEERIVIQDKTGKNSIVINSKDNTMAISVEKDLTIVAKGKATIESTDNMTIKTKGDLSVECNNFKVKANANAKVEATANVDVKGTGQVNIKGSQTTVEGDAMTQVKSNASVQIQSTALVKVQGNPIMLN